MPIDVKKSPSFRSGQYLELNDLNQAKVFIKQLTEPERNLLYEALTVKPSIKK